MEEFAPSVSPILSQPGGYLLVVLADLVGKMLAELVEKPANLLDLLAPFAGCDLEQCLEVRRGDIQPVRWETRRFRHKTDRGLSGMTLKKTMALRPYFISTGIGSIPPTNLRLASQAQAGPVPK